MSEFVEKLLASIQKLFEYNIINKIQTGDRAYDSLISGLLILIISYALKKDLFIYLSTHYRRFIPQKLSSMLYKQKEMYVRGTKFLVIPPEESEIYKAQYYTKESYHVIYWDGLSKTFEDNLVEYLSENYASLTKYTRYVLTKTETRLPKSRKTMSEFQHGVKNKPIPIFYHEGEIILLNYNPDSDSYELHYKSYNTLKIFNELVHSYGYSPEEEKKNQVVNNNNIYDLYISKENSLELTEKGRIYDDRTFDTFISRYKPQIMASLDNFVAVNNGETKKFGGFGSYNLGLLLYGRPGCGKTMLIKAIANYLNRDVINVDMRLIKTKSMFERLFTVGNGVRYNIYVFEEFDCIQGIISRDMETCSVSTGDDSLKGPDEIVKRFSPPLYQRSSYRDTSNLFGEPDEKAELKRERLNLVSILSRASDEKVRNSIQETIKEIDKKLQLLGDGLTLDTMLTVLDGVHERRNRIIIATTNYPDRIDPALLREGRFDKKLNLSEFNTEEIRELLSLMYKDDPDQELIQHTKFIGDVLTPTQIMNVCFSTESLKPALDLLSNEEYVKNLHKSSVKKTEVPPIKLLSEEEKQAKLKEIKKKTKLQQNKTVTVAKKKKSTDDTTDDVGDDIDDDVDDVGDDAIVD